MLADALWDVNHMPGFMMEGLNIIAHCLDSITAGADAERNTNDDA